MDQGAMRQIAIIRADLQMTPGKMAAQAGHAFVGAWVETSKCNYVTNWCGLSGDDVTRRVHWTGRAEEYWKLDPGTKIVLQSRDVHGLKYAKKIMDQLGIPNYLVVDRGHIMLPHFTGEPTITAFGIAPVYKDEVAILTDRFKLA